MFALTIVAVCLILNALLSCAEMAFVTVDKKELRKLALGGDKRAEIVGKMLENPERLLSAIQIGITFVGAISAAVGGAGAEESITPKVIEWFNVSEATAETIAISLVVVPLTLLSVIIGELVPKSIALRYSQTVIINLSKALRLAEKVLGPLIKPMEVATKFFLRLILPKEIEDQVIKNDEEVSLAGLKKTHKKYIFNLIDLESKTVQSTMRPWDDVDFVNYDSDANQVVEKIIANGHTRLPVVADKEVCGFLHAKEFLNLFRNGAADNWVSFMRPPKFVQPDEKLFDVLRMMQKKRIHILIVGDETNYQGIVTLEDVLEEVFGDIVDEDEDGQIELYLRRNMLDSKFKIITKT